jgi:hypothetical protein
MFPMWGISRDCASAVRPNAYSSSAKNCHILAMPPTRPPRPNPQSLSKFQPPLHIDSSRQRSKTLHPRVTSLSSTLPTLPTPALLPLRDRRQCTEWHSRRSGGSLVRRRPARPCPRPSPRRLQLPRRLRTPGMGHRRTPLRTRGTRPRRIRSSRRGQPYALPPPPRRPRRSSVRRRERSKSGRSACFEARHPLLSPSPPPTPRPWRSERSTSGHSVSFVDATKCQRRPSPPPLQPPWSSPSPPLTGPRRRERGECARGAAQTTSGYMIPACYCASIVVTSLPYPCTCSHQPLRNS